MKTEPPINYRVFRLQRLPLVPDMKRLLFLGHLLSFSAKNLQEMLNQHLANNDKNTMNREFLVASQHPRNIILFF